MKLVSILALIGALFSLPVAAEGLFDIHDAPDSAIAVGVGAGPTTSDVNVFAGYAKLIPGTKATYSYSGVSAIPALITNPKGGKSLSLTPVSHTGVKQIFAEYKRLVVAGDIGGGVSLPSNDVDAFNFAVAGGLDFGFRTNKEKHLLPGEKNWYIGLSPRFTQLTGTPGGTIVSVGISFVQTSNGK